MTTRWRPGEQGGPQGGGQPTGYYPLRRILMKGALIQVMSAPPDSGEPPVVTIVLNSQSDKAILKRASEIAIGLRDALFAIDPTARIDTPIQALRARAHAENASEDPSQRKSYAQIAREQNSDVFELLKRALSQPEHTSDQVASTAAYTTALVIMRAFFPGSDQDVVLKVWEVLATLEDHAQPPPDYPITKEHVLNMLRTWRGRGAGTPAGSSRAGLPRSKARKLSG